MSTYIKKKVNKKVWSSCLDKKKKNQSVHLLKSEVKQCAVYGKQIALVIELPKGCWTHRNTRTWCRVITPIWAFASKAAKAKQTFYKLYVE